MRVDPGNRLAQHAAHALAILLVSTSALFLAGGDPPEADQDRRPTAGRPSEQAAAARPSVRRHAALREQVQELLARGGCPGWMAMAGEPDLLKPDSDLPVQDVVHRTLTDIVHRTLTEVDAPSVSPGVVTPTSYRVADAPAIGVDGTRPAAPTDEASRDAPQDLAPVAPGEEEASLVADDLLLEAEDLLLDRSDLLATPPKTPNAAADSLLEAQDLLNDREDLLTPPAAPPTVPSEPPTSGLPSPEPTSPLEEQLPLPGPPMPADVDAPRLPVKSTPPEDPHAALYAETLYPSAESCRPCHETIYEEWSVSGHAYAAVSPMFHRFEQTIHQLTHGTIGYFCYRCHTPVGTALGVPRDVPLWTAPQVAQEGVTCVACHRINENYGKTNGERHIVPGDIYAPVYGSIGGDGVARVIAEKSKWKVKTSPHEKGPGQPIHGAGICFPQLHKSEFCASCHQVAVHPGVKLEVVWEQYRASPACKKGVSCQDCHMGRIPGIASGYARGPAAVVNDKPVDPNRKHANHSFYGPGYSIAHPGVFPWNPKAKRWTTPEWLQFDWRAGWGTDAFEEALEAGEIAATFPPVWDNVDDRYDARDIIAANQEKLARKRLLRQQVYENGSHVDGPFFDKSPQRGKDLRLHYLIINTNDGHNLPTASLGAQPQFWANVALIGPRGRRLWETGYTDRYGDLANIHSIEVREKRIPYDWQLFNLQTMFLITGVKGTDREFPLPVNVDVDQLPFIRPGVQPIPLINHPPFIRMEGRSLAPLGSRRIRYKIPADAFAEPGRYRLAFRMRNRAEPIYFMRFCNSTPEMIRAMNEGILDVHTSCVEFEVR